MKEKINLLFKKLTPYIDKYRVWFWLVGILSLVAALLIVNYAVSAILFVLAVAAFTLAMKIDRFFRERPPFNLAGFLLWILGGFTLACLWAAVGVILLTEIQ